MADAQLLPEKALKGVDIGLSVSDSADLAALGLSPRHAELAIGELARAILVAGGEITYGGRLTPSGFTHVLIDEVHRYATNRPALTICLAWPEHRKMTITELDRTDRQLGSWGQLITLDPAGNPCAWSLGRTEESIDVTDPQERQRSYTSLREFMVARTRARVLVGGQIAHSSSSIPGVLEEAVLSLRAGSSLYLAAGFGGATAAAARALTPHWLEWLPSDLPEGFNNSLTQQALSSVRQVANEAGWTVTSNGLGEQEGRLLATTHRPGDIATLVVRGMTRVVGSS